jgi:hypothetical protein
MKQAKQSTSRIDVKILLLPALSYPDLSVLNFAIIEHNIIWLRVTYNICVYTVTSSILALRMKENWP